MSGAGDRDSDGVPDAIVGAPYYDDGATSDCGSVYIFEGGSSMDTTADWNHVGEQAGDHFGWSVSLAGNMNNGNYNMSVVGAPHHDNGANTDAGEAEVLVIPEFSDMILPTAGMILSFVFGRRKKRKSSIK